MAWHGGGHYATEVTEYTEPMVGWKDKHPQSVGWLHLVNR
jgi:hypothetical protein